MLPPNWNLSGFQRPTAWILIMVFAHITPVNLPILVLTVVEVIMGVRHVLNSQTPTPLTRLRLYHSAVIYSYGPPPGNNRDLNSRPANPCYKPNHLCTLNCNVCLKYNFFTFAPHNWDDAKVEIPNGPQPCLEGKWGGSGYKCVVYKIPTNSVQVCKIIRM